MILTWWVDVVESVTLSFMTWPVVECPVSMARQKVIHLSSDYGRSIIKVGYFFSDSRHRLIPNGDGPSLDPSVRVVRTPPGFGQKQLGR